MLFDWSCSDDTTRLSPNKCLQTASAEQYNFLEHAKHIYWIVSDPPFLYARRNLKMKGLGLSISILAHRFEFVFLEMCKVANWKSIWRTFIKMREPQFITWTLEGHIVWIHIRMCVLKNKTDVLLALSSTVHTQENPQTTTMWLNNKTNIRFASSFHQRVQLSQSIHPFP